MTRLSLRAGMLLAISTAACSPSADAARRVVREDSAGVAIVRNLAPDRTLAWSFEPALRLGGADEGPESFYQLSSSSIGVDGRGNLHVLDAANHRVVVFSPTGEHLRTLGRRGGGPGEMEMPFIVSVEADGTVHVRDMSKPAMVSWTPDGEPITTEPLQIGVYGPYSVSGDALITTVGGPGAEEGQVRTRLLVMRPGDTTEVAALVEPVAKVVDFGCVAMNAPPHFTPRIVWDADGARVAATAGVSYEVRVVDAGRVTSIRRALEPRPTTREMALQDLPEGITVRFAGAAPDCKVAAEVVIERQGYAAVLPSIRRISLAPGGEVWVERNHIKGETAPIDVFAANGEYLGTLPADSPFPAAFTPGGDVVSIESDEMDVDRLVVYRLVRAAEGV